MEKSQTNATSVTLHPHGQVIWGGVWKRTVEKSQTNATNVTMHRFMQAIWGHIWKRTVEKSHTNATNVTDASAHAHNLKTHLIMNTGEKSNECIQCDYASSEASKLVRHLKTHTGEKSDKCNQWNYTTFLHRVSGWQFGKTKSYHHTSTQTKFWKCKDWVGADVYKLTVHQHMKYIMWTLEIAQPHSVSTSKVELDG